MLKLTNLEFKRALLMPFKGEGWTTRIALGTLVWLAPLLCCFVDTWLAIGVLLNVLILTTGYCMLVMEQEVSAAPDKLPTSLPNATGFDELFAKGGKILSLSVLYLGGLFSLGYMLRILTGLPLFELSRMNELDRTSYGITVAFLGLGGFMLIGYLPAMAANIAREKTWKAGFHAWRIIKVMFHERDGFYASMAMWVLLHLALPLFLFFPPLLFVAQVISANLWGQAYRVARAPKASAQ